jgi:surface antigen
MLFFAGAERRHIVQLFADLMSRGEEMSLRINKFAPVVAGLMIAGAAQAQLLPTWETNITLTQQDLDMIHSAVTNQVHGKPVGTTASWSNPASGNSGSIKLVKKLARKDQRCEDIEYTVRSGGTPVYTEHYHFISCLQPDGTWKIA